MDIKETYDLFIKFHKTKDLSLIDEIIKSNKFNSLLRILLLNNNEFIKHESSITLLINNLPIKVIISFVELYSANIYKEIILNLSTNQELINYFKLQSI